MLPTLNIPYGAHVPGAVQFGGFILPQVTRFYSIDDLTHLPKPAWMIEGLFEAKSIVMLAGPPGCLKSFMALDWMLSMATGRKWNDRATAEAKMLYVLGEGRANLLKRIETWCAYHKVTETEKTKLAENFRVTFDVPAMALKPSVDNMLAGLVESNFQPDLICIDTLSRSFVGMDENSQKDTGMWIEQAERLRDMGRTVLILHHTAKNTEFGYQYRGSSVIHGAMDTSMVQTCKDDSIVTLKITKQKDHDEGKPMKFNKLVVKAHGPDDEGSVVLVPSVIADEQYTPTQPQQVTMANGGIEARLQSLLFDTRYGSDVDRARVLMQEYPELNLTEGAAKQRVSRKRDAMVAVGWLPKPLRPVSQAQPVTSPVTSCDIEENEGEPKSGFNLMAARGYGE